MPKQNPYKKKEYVGGKKQENQSQQPHKTPNFDIDEILKKIKDQESEQN